MAIRIFKMSDAVMHQKSKVYRVHFMNRKAVFVAFDADFADPFVTNWLNGITASEAVDTAETRDDQLQTETAEVNAEMVLAQKKYVEAKYFIVKTFPGMPGVQGEFGLNTYSSIRNNQAEMIPFMQNLWDKAENKYKTQLLAQGYTQPKIDEILAIKNSLDTEDVEQEVFKDEEVTATAARIALLNTTFGFDKLVNAAAHVIYADDLPTLHLFLLGRHDEPAGVYTIIGAVTNAATGLPEADVEVRVSSPSFSVLTDVDGLYGLALPDDTYTVTFAKAGFTTQIFTITVSGGVPMTRCGDGGLGF